MDQTVIAVITINDNNDVVYINHAAETLWGYKAEEVLGKNVRMLVPKVHQKNHDSYVNRHRATNEDRIVGSAVELQI